MNKNKQVEIGDLIVVDVFEPSFGKYPIGRHEGRICKIHMNDNIKFIEYGCTIEAWVVEIKPKVLTVLIASVVVSAAENNRLNEEAVNKLLERAKANKGHKIIL